MRRNNLELFQIGNPTCVSTPCPIENAGPSAILMHVTARIHGECNSIGMDIDHKRSLRESRSRPIGPCVVKHLCSFSTLTGFGLAVEIGDWQRFTGNTIGSYVGLVPSEYSSGTSRSQGSITKTGSGHARRFLVEAAWHHRKIYRAPGQVMRIRWAKASPAARAHGHAGNRRWE